MFKRFAKVQAGVMGYRDTYNCRCCGSELINAKLLLENAQEKYVRDYAEKLRHTEQFKIGFTYHEPPEGLYNIPSDGPKEVSNEPRTDENS